MKSWSEVAGNEGSHTTREPYPPHAKSTRDDTRAEPTYSPSSSHTYGLDWSMASDARGTLVRMLENNDSKKSPYARSKTSADLRSAHSWATVETDISWSARTNVLHKASADTSSYEWDYWSRSSGNSH